MNYSRRLSWMLVLVGAAGLLVALAMLPLGLISIGITLGSSLFYAVFAAGYAPTVLAILSVLLFVAGRRRDYVGSGIAAAVAVSYLLAYWRIQIWIAESGKVGPLAILVLATAVGTAAVSVHALMSASALRSEVKLSAEES